MYAASETIAYVKSSYQLSGSFAKHTYTHIHERGRTSLVLKQRNRSTDFFFLLEITYIYASKKYA